MESRINIDINIQESSQSQQEIIINACVIQSLVVANICVTRRNWYFPLLNKRCMTSCINVYKQMEYRLQIP